jgi:SsrA-binding protein
MKHINIKNKRATFEFQILDKYVAGLQLTGTEIKSIRDSKAMITDAFCAFKPDGALYVRNMHIAEYKFGTYANHEPKRERKLLLNQQELDKLQKKLKDQGLTIVPLRLFINDKGWAKLEIALAKGKKIHDKRDSLKEKSTQREMDRAGKL